MLLSLNMTKLLYQLIQLDWAGQNSRLVLHVIDRFGIETDYAQRKITMKDQ